MLVKTPQNELLADEITVLYSKAMRTAIDKIFIHNNNLLINIDKLCIQVWDISDIYHPTYLSIIPFENGTRLKFSSDYNYSLFEVYENKGPPMRARTDLCKIDLNNYEIKIKVVFRDYIAPTMFTFDATYLIYDLNYKITFLKLDTFNKVCDFKLPVTHLDTRRLALAPDGNYLVITDGPNLYLYNIADVAAPKLIGSLALATTGIKCFFSLVINMNWEIITDNNDILRLKELQKPKKIYETLRDDLPTYIGRHVTPLVLDYLYAPIFSKYHRNTFFKQSEALVTHELTPPPRPLPKQCCVIS